MKNILENIILPLLSLIFFIFLICILIWAFTFGEPLKGAMDNFFLRPIAIQYMIKKLNYDYEYFNGSKHIKKKTREIDGDIYYYYKHPVVYNTSSHKWHYYYDCEYVYDCVKNCIYMEQREAEKLYHKNLITMCNRCLNELEEEYEKDPCSVDESACY